MPGIPAGLIAPDDFTGALGGGGIGGHGLTSAGLPLMGAVTSVHNSNSSIGANAGSTGHLSMRDTASMAGSPGAGPIRNRSRMNTSPYGSDRHGGGGGGGGGANHLSPPDPSWRRVVSDSALHKSVGVSYDNAMSVAQGLMLGQGGLQMGSPLQGASPTMIRRDCKSCFFSFSYCIVLLVLLE